MHATPTPAGFGDHERHGATVDWCRSLSLVLSGQAAERLLAADAVPEHCGIVLLPNWLWSDSLQVGRKSMARGGGTLLLPVRVNWSSGPVVLVADSSSATQDWEAHGPKFDAEGRTTVTCSSTMTAWDPSQLDDMDTPPGAVVCGTMPRDQAVRHLRELAERGQLARWEAIETIRVWVERSVRHQHSWMSAEVTGRDATPLLDYTALDRVADRILLGVPGDTTAPEAMRMVEQSLQPTAYVRAEPTLWLRTAIRRAVQQELRREIGDPNAGPRIRSVARGLGVTGAASEQDVLRVVTACREQYPNERIGAVRVRNALTAGPILEADALFVDEGPRRD